MTARTRHGLTEDDRALIETAWKILERFRLQIEDALSRDCNHPNSCPDVIDALRVMARAKLKEPKEQGG